MMKSDRETVRKILTDAIVALCNSGLAYTRELSVEGLLGITLDKRDVFLVNVNECIKNINAPPHPGRRKSSPGTYIRMYAHKKLQQARRRKPAIVHRAVPVQVATAEEDCEEGPGGDEEMPVSGSAKEEKINKQPKDLVEDQGDSPTNEGLPPRKRARKAHPRQLAPSEGTQAPPTPANFTQSDYLPDTQESLTDETVRMAVEMAIQQNVPELDQDTEECLLDESQIQLHEEDFTPQTRLKSKNQKLVLPNPEEAVNLEQAEMIRVLNEVVGRGFQEKMEKRKKRGEYITYTSELRARIGQFAVDHGISPTVRKFSRELGRTVSDSTVRCLKKEYLAAKEKAEEEGTEITALPKKDRGRPLMLREYDGEVAQYIDSLRQTGTQITYHIVMDAARGVLLHHDKARLKEFGGKVEITKGWAESFIKRMQKNFQWARELREVSQMVSSGTMVPHRRTKVKGAQAAATMVEVVTPLPPVSTLTPDNQLEPPQVMTLPLSIAPPGMPPRPNSTTSVLSQNHVGPPPQGPDPNTQHVVLVASSSNDPTISGGYCSPIYSNATLALPDHSVSPNSLMSLTHHNPGIMPTHFSGVTASYTNLSPAAVFSNGPPMHSYASPHTPAPPVPHQPGPVDSPHTDGHDNSSVTHSIFGHRLSL